jgi:hypothetical protein
MGRKKTHQIFLLISVLVCCMSCASRPTVDVWGDASTIAQQQLVIEQQRATLVDMAESLGELQSNLEVARNELERSIATGTDIRTQWAAIERFVESIIEAERRLEELQRSDQ